MSVCMSVSACACMHIHVHEYECVQHGYYCTCTCSLQSCTTGNLPSYHTSLDFVAVFQECNASTFLHPTQCTTAPTTVCVCVCELGGPST